MPLKDNDAIRKFAFQVVEVIQWDRPQQRKLGEICRLTRVLKGLAGADVASKAGCSASHYYTVESGEKKSLESYRRPIEALGLDRERLLLFVAAPQTISIDQAKALLLDDRSGPGSVNGGEAASNAGTRDALVSDIVTVLGKDCPIEQKVGAICRHVREWQNWTLKAIGHRVGRTNIYIAAMEKGEKPLDRYPPLLLALGLDPSACFRAIDQGPTAATPSFVEAMLDALQARKGAKERIKQHVTQMLEQSGTTEPFDVDTWLTAWMDTRIPALGATPSELCWTEAGLRQVINVLECTKHSVYM